MMKEMLDKPNKKTWDRLDFVNYIQDNVHGQIGLTRLEDNIERTPIFKRLQDISQFGLIKRVFPGAVHNRYIHSLGVMYVIDQMAIHLEEFSLAERQLLRLAGMLHDLGHYPLSHDIEQVYDRVDDIRKHSSKKIREIFFEDIKKDIEKIETEISLLDIKKEELRPNDSPEDNEIVKNLRPKRFMVKNSEYHHEVVTTRVIKHSGKIREYVLDAVKGGAFGKKRDGMTVDE